MNKSTVIIDYGVGNIGSVLNMIKRLGHNVVIASRPELIAPGQRIILCGVGAFDNGMHKLESSGMIDALNQAVLIDKKPVLGICLGMQLMTEESEEGSKKGLGWIPGRVRKFNFSVLDQSASYKVPHMGWNEVKAVRKHQMLEGLYDDARFYFVHSYHVEVDQPEAVLLSCHYGYDFIAAFQYENIMGVQFHPEKSHRFGLQLYKNFIENF